MPFWKRRQELEDASQWKGKLLTYEELAKLLNVPIVDGAINTTELVNACINVQTNPAVQRLPYEYRLQAIATAEAAISELMSGDSG